MVMMTDLRELRNRRLYNEYQELMRISGSIIQVVPFGQMPYETYRIVFHIRTITGPAPTFRDQTACTLTIPPNYPDGAPILTANEAPFPWHINWYQNGRWCFGDWNKEESLVNYLNRCARTLQFDPGIANSDSVANADALPFWEANRRNPGVIPSDTQVLPTPDAPETITILAWQTPRIVIRGGTDKLRIRILKKD
jgi:ubiquitin-protein ligase